MQIPLIDVRSQYDELRTEIDEAMKRVMESGVYIGGPEVELLEQEICKLTHSKYAVAVANGTDALLLSLEASGIGPGDEVITTPFTFFATAEAIMRRGAKPVFADIDPKTFNLSPELAAAKITPQTKAIIPVHLFGQPADMDAFRELAIQYELILIEDACQAIGALYKGKPVGSIGDIGCFSFFPTKNLGCCGDGGMVVTNNKLWAERVRLLAHHGSRKKYYHEIAGCNSRLDPLQAAVLRVKLRKLTDWNDRRIQAAHYYTSQLTGTELETPEVDPHVKHVFHLYVLQCNNRHYYANKLKEHGIATGHYYPCPLHLQQALSGYGYRTGGCPVSEQACSRSLSLPLSPHLTKEQQNKILHFIQH